jgi:hypothetical protein
MDPKHSLKVCLPYLLLFSVLGLALPGLDFGLLHAASQYLLLIYCLLLCEFLHGSPLHTVLHIPACSHLI